MSGRVVAVLGYSGRRNTEIHRVCAARLAHAQGLAAENGTVILSGEADQMRAAWAGPEVVLVCDTESRSTVDNAANVAAAARELGAEEVCVVTSSWHRPRAAVLLRAAFRGSPVRLTVEPVPGRPSPYLLARETGALLLLPAQLAKLRLALRRRDRRRNE